MKTTIALLLLTALLSQSCDNDLVVPEPEEQANVTYETHPKNSTYQQALDNYRLSSRSPGSVLLIHKPADAVWIGASGQSNLAHGTSMKTTSRFRTGSITKMFIAVAIVKLAEQEKLALDETLKTHLPEMDGKISQAGKITIRHLLAHLSGIVDPPNESFRYKGDLINDPVRMSDLSVDKILETYVFGEDLHFTPGSGYSYSNTNYWLLGKIAERVTGQPLEQVMKELIFDPAQLTNTYIDKRDDRNVARGYADLYSNGVLLDVSLWDRAEGDGRADGGLISTAEDLFKFMHALFEGDLVSAASLKDMKRVQLAGCDSPYCEYGLGLELWRVESGIAYGHNGALIGIEANALYYENSGGISVLFRNRGDGSDKRWLDAVMK